MVLYRRSPGPVFWELKACAGEWHSTLAHSHAEWSAGFVESGSCTVGLAGRPVRIAAPALVWFPPEAVHECRPDQTEEWAFRMVYWPAPATGEGPGWRPLDAAEVREWTAFLDRLAGGGSPGEVPAWLAARGFGRPGPGSSLAPGLPGEPDRGTPAGPGLARPDRPYKRRYGLAPARHRTILRLRRGQELLRRGRSPAEAALEAGFYDQSQFTRTFRAFTGTTPGSYARQGS